MRRHVAVGRSAEDAKMRADGNDRPNGELVWANRQGLTLIAFSAPNLLPFRCLETLRLS